MCCKCWMIALANGQNSLAWRMGLHVQELYTWPQDLQDGWRNVRICSSSLNVFLAVLTWILTASSQPLSMESTSPRQQMEATISSLLGPTLIKHSLVCRSVMCRRCCCCPLLYDRPHMGTCLYSAGGPGLYCTSCALTLNPYFSMAFFYIIKSCLLL